MSDSYTIRRFRPEEVMLYKAMRLEALQHEPGMFGNSYAFEAAFTDEQWAARVADKDSARFGLYHDSDLIGITGIVTDKEKPGEGYMTQSYIQRPYRGKGLSRMLYEARIKWANDYGLKRLVIGHKESNIVSKAANQRFGFTYTHKEMRNWPDGSVEAMLYYELVL